MAMPPRPPLMRPRINNVTSMHKIALSGDLTIDPAEIAGKSIGILGATGSGKSTTVRRMLEQLLKVGVPFTVCDIENEYATLKEVGEVLIAGPRVDHGKIQIDVALTNEKQCAALGKRAYQERRSVILLLGDLDEDTARLFLRAYLDGLFYAANDPDRRTVHVVAVEEIQEWAPQVGISKDDPLLKTCIRLSKRGRKRGISLWPISQRPANVDKNILTQCQFFFAHSVNYVTDMNTYKALFSTSELETRVNAFTPGDVLFKNGKNEVITHISMPQTTSPSSTPGSVDPSKFKTIADAHMLDEDISRADSADGVNVIPAAEYARLKERADAVEEMQHALAQAVEIQGTLDAEIKRLEQQRSEERITYVTAENEDVGAIKTELARAQEALARAEAQAAPIRLLLNLLEQQGVLLGNRSD